MNPSHAAVATTSSVVSLSWTVIAQSSSSSAAQTASMFENVNHEASVVPDTVGVLHVECALHSAGLPIVRLCLVTNGHRDTGDRLSGRVVGRVLQALVGLREGSNKDVVISVRQTSGIEIIHPLGQANPQFDGNAAF